MTSEARLASRAQRTLLVYPFQHDLEGRGRGARLAAQSEWVHYWDRLSLEPGGESNQSLDRVVADSFYFLPHLRPMLYPELAHLTRGGSSVQASMAAARAERSSWRGDGAAQRRFTAALNPESTLRLTLPIGPLTKQPWKLLYREAGHEFRLNWVDALLFPQRVGLLLAEVSVESCETAAELANFLAALRMVHPPVPGGPRSQWRRPGRADRYITARALIRRALRTLPGCEAYRGAAFTDSEFAQVYGDVAQLYTVAAVADDVTEELAATAAYEIATCTDTRVPMFRPADGYVTEQTPHFSYSRWGNWRGIATQEHVLVLATRTDGFTTGALINNATGEYANLYLLVLYHRLRLSTFFGDLIRPDYDITRNVREVSSLLDRFVRFQNRYWFNEVTRKPQGTDLYRWMHRGMGVRELYQELREQMQDLREHYDRLEERSTGAVLRMITLLGIPGGFALGLYGQTWGNALLDHSRFGNIPVHLQFLIVFVAMLGIVLLGQSALMRWRQRTDRRHSR